MPWKRVSPLRWAVCIHPWVAKGLEELPLQVGDELYPIEKGGEDNAWYRGYLVAAPSLIAGLTTSKGRSLNKRVYIGTFPVACVELRQVVDDGDNPDQRRVPGEKLQLDRSHRTSGIVTLFQNGESTLPKTLASSQNISDEELHKLQNEFPTPPGQKDTSTQSFQSHEDAQTLQPQTTHSYKKHTSMSGKPQAPVPVLKISDESPEAVEEPLIDEIASCLREWHASVLHELLLERRYDDADVLKDLVDRLYLARRKILCNILTDYELEELRAEALADMVTGNKLFGGGLIVRSKEDKGRVMTANDSCVEVTKRQAMMSFGDKMEEHRRDLKALYQVCMSLIRFQSNSDAVARLEFCLYLKPEGADAQILSETFSVEVGDRQAGGVHVFGGSRKTVFADVTGADMADQSGERSSVYLVVKIISQEHIYSRRPSASLPSPMQTGSPTEPGAPTEIPVSTVPRSFNSAFRTGSLREGRQSFMWGRKGRKESEPSTSKHSASRADGSASEERGRHGQTNLHSVPETSQEETLIKRVTGFAVVNITKHVLSLEESDIKIDVRPISALNAATTWANNEERDVALEALGKHVNSKSRLENSTLSLRLNPFQDPNAHNLYRTIPTLFHDVITSPRTSFAGAPRQQRSDVYLSLKTVKLPLNALLLHPREDHVPIPTDINMANLMVILEVRDEDGNLQKSAICPGSSRNAQTAWRSYAIQRGESWNQTVRLNVDPHIIHRCHVIFSLWEGDEPKPFALFWMPLWKNGAFIQDADHVLSMYKYDSSTSGDEHRRRPYLDLPWRARTRDETVTGPLASVVVSTKSCSTAFSQSNILLRLLKWEDQKDEDVLAILKQFPFVAEQETVKFLKDVMHSLFGIVVHFSGKEEFEDLVLEALVRTLGIVHDRRFNLQPVVDDYAENDFNYPFAFPCLSRSWNRMLEDPATPENSKRLRSTFKVGAHILKFMIKARQQQVRKEVDIGINSHRPTFAKDLNGLFSGIETLMGSKKEVLVGNKTRDALLGTKTIAIQNFHTYLPELKGVMNSEEILTVAINFVNALSQVEGQTILYKLVLIQHISDAEIFPAEETRTEWLRHVADWISPHWGLADDPPPQWRDQIRLCCTIVATLYEKYGTANTVFWTRKLYQSYLIIRENPQLHSPANVVTPLFPTSYPFPTTHSGAKAQYDEALLELAALLAETASTPPEQYPDLPVNELSTGLSAILDVGKSILDFDAFPSDWLTIHIYHHRSCLRFMQSLYQVLTVKFLPEPDDALSFDDKLWYSFLTMLLRLVTSKAVEVERFPEQRRRAVWKVGGDIREGGAELLALSWHALGWELSDQDQSTYGIDKVGGLQSGLAPLLVAPLVELCLSPHDGLRSVGISVMRSIIIGTWMLDGNLDVVQTSMIDSLDHVFEQQVFSGEALHSVFVDELRACFDQDASLTDQRLRDATQSLLTTISGLLDLLVAAYVPEFAGESGQHYEVVRLLEYYKALGKFDKYVGYVHRLSIMHVQAKNFTEAGLALQLHADIIEWDTETVLPAITDLAFPSQTAFQRKEQICFKMLEHYETSRAWYHALEVHAELATQYMKTTFDYSKLARAQRATAVINEKISKGDRRDCRYFRVQFRGLGFFDALRDKQFIFETEGTDRSSAFEDRLQGQYPNAKLVGGGELREVEGQYISVSPVSIQPDYSQPVHRYYNASLAIKDHVMYATPTKFGYTTRKVSNSQPVTEQIQEKTIFTVAKPFPTVLRRSEITKIEKVTIDPIHIGIDRTTRKTRELGQRIDQAQEGGEANMTALTEMLMILVSSKSPGGVWRYWDLLLEEKRPVKAQCLDPLSDDFDLEPPVTDAELIRQVQDPMRQALKASLVEHYLKIRFALDIYARGAHLATRADLQKEIATTFAPIIEYYALITPSRAESSKPAARAQSPTNTAPPKPSGEGVVPHTQSKHEVTSTQGGVTHLATPPLGTLGLEGLDDPEHLPGGHKKGGGFFKRLSKLDVGAR
ncbi:MAG: hypothetical protein Q9162_006556 [Coniocarpon cinnabarinum]